MNIFFLLLFLLAGFVIGYLRLFPEEAYKYTDKLTMVGLIVLLISMGAKIGANEDILKQLDRIGIQALLLALGSIAGSIIMVKVFTLRMKFEVKVKEKKPEVEKLEDTNRLMTFIIIFSVIGGILCGLLLIPYEYLAMLDLVTTYMLAVIFFGVGIDIGRKREILAQIKESGYGILLIPLLIAAGSIAGAYFAGFFVGLHIEAAAVGAGFGWYSLSGVLLSQLHSVELGSLAFLANVTRELISVLIMPFVVKYFGKVTAIAPGGATTMDVTLPVIKEIAGDEMVIPAFISGVVLTALVPILVPFIIGL